MPRTAAPARGFAFGDASAVPEAARRNETHSATHTLTTVSVLPPPSSPGRAGTAREDLALRPILRGRAGPPDRFARKRTSEQETTT